MRRTLGFGIAAAALAAASPLAVHAAAPTAPAAATSEDARLTAFLNAEFDQEVAASPQLATRLGLKLNNDKLNDNSDAAALKRLEWRRASVANMKKQFDRAKLSPAAQANYDIWALELERSELQYKFRKFAPPFYSFLYSAHQQLPNFLISSHTVSDVADMRAYNSRLRGFTQSLDTALAQSRASDAAGIRAPKFQVERVIAGSRAIITGAPFDGGADSALWADAKAKVAKLKLPAAEADALLADTRTSLLSIKPVYERIIAWAESDLPKAPSGRVGAISLPGGAAYYAAALKLNTTTDMTPEQVHQKGLSEVARIEGEQDALARSAGFKDRHAFYAERERVAPPVPWTDALRAEYLKTANDAVARARSLLPNYFGQLPQYRMEVQREPSFSEVAGGAAHASGPSPDGVRPGRVWVHLLGTTGDPAAIQDLMCHEAVPGHVTQGDIQARQSAGPKFRKTYGYVAFSEGWGLYSEAVCKEMGAFQSPAEDFMRLDAELFRAARLVVDTGIHAKGWTEEQADKYLIETGRTSQQQGISEVRRYITLPGQATGYKIGMLKIVELRRKAEAALGPKFDIKSFHDLLIGSGSLPLSVLEQQVDNWIASRK